MTVPDEAVEAARSKYREVLIELRLSEGGGFKVGSQVSRAIAAAVTAAAPFIAAQAWDEGARAMFVDDPLAPTPTNPYRSGT